MASFGCEGGFFLQKNKKNTQRGTLARYWVLIVKIINSKPSKT